MIARSHPGRPFGRRGVGRWRAAASPPRSVAALDIAGLRRLQRMTAEEDQATKELVEPIGGLSREKFESDAYDAGLRSYSRCAQR
jgi:hypothetical protein